MFNRAYRVIAVSGQERADLIDFYGVEPAKVVVVGRPVADVFLRPAHDERGRPRSLLPDR